MFWRKTVKPSQLQRVHIRDICLPRSVGPYRSSRKSMTNLQPCSGSDLTSRNHRHILQAEAEVWATEGHAPGSTKRKSRDPTSSQCFSHRPPRIRVTIESENELHHRIAELLDPAFRPAILRKAHPCFSFPCTVLGCMLVFHPTAECNSPGIAPEASMALAASIIEGADPSSANKAYSAFSSFTLFP